MSKKVATTADKKKKDKEQESYKYQLEDYTELEQRAVL